MLASDFGARAGGVENGRSRLRRACTGTAAFRQRPLIGTAGTACDIRELEAA